jgi:hypothetical protein
VAWAGEAESTNLFDTAREYTERWHHDMQIRSPLGAQGHAEALLEERLAVPRFGATKCHAPLSLKGRTTFSQHSGARAQSWCDAIVTASEPESEN